MDLTFLLGGDLWVNRVGYGAMRLCAQAAPAVAERRHPGMTSISHLEEHVAACRAALSDGEFAALSSRS